jgi:hypothetical protein
MKLCNLGAKLRIAFATSAQNHATSMQPRVPGSRFLSRFSAKIKFKIGILTKLRVVFATYATSNPTILTVFLSTLLINRRLKG